LVRAHEEQAVVVDNGDAKAVKPTGAAKEVPVEYGVLGKEDGRGKLDTKRLNCDLVLLGCKRPSHGPETLKAAGIDVHSKHLSVLALKDAMCGARIQFCQERNRLPPDA
jgi:hypothetical protein